MPLARLITSLSPTTPLIEPTRHGAFPISMARRLWLGGQSAAQGAGAMPRADEWSALQGAGGVTGGSGRR